MMNTVEKKEIDAVSLGVIASHLRCSYDRLIADMMDDLMRFGRG